MITLSKTGNHWLIKATMSSQSLWHFTLSFLYFQLRGCIKSELLSTKKFQISSNHCNTLCITEQYLLL